MAIKHLILLVILTIINPSIQNLDNNEVEVEDVNPFAEAASAILKEQNGENIGAMVNNFLESGGGKQIGDMLSNLGGTGGEGGGQLGDILSNLGGAEGAGQLLQGLGSLMGGGGGQGGIDPAMIGALMGMINTKPASKNAKKAPEAGFDANDLLSLAGNFLGQPGNAEGLMDMLPVVMQTIGAFTGPEAEKRADSHTGHSWMLPPFLEKMHVFFDHFLHSEMGKVVINALGAEKIFKIFADENGRFSYQKFGAMLENHSFRRHWISMVTNRIAVALSYAADPKIQKKYLSSGQYFFNSYIKSQGFPKTAMFEVTRPTESITAFVNHLALKYFNFKFNAKQYVKPAVDYVQELLRLVNKKGLMKNTEGSRELSDKLADTINLEIIEPLVRVNRAFRFAKNVPSCDRYVFCLVNEANPNEQVSLPGLKSMLSKGGSLAASWFLSEHTGTPFWTLYTDITEDVRCKTLYSEKCNDFHIEEEKVTTEYVHNEL